MRCSISSVSASASASSFSWRLNRRRKNNRTCPVSVVGWMPAGFGLSAFAANLMRFSAGGGMIFVDDVDDVLDSSWANLRRGLSNIRIRMNSTRAGAPIIHFAYNFITSGLISNLSDSLRKAVLIRVPTEAAVSFSSVSGDCCWVGAHWVSAWSSPNTICGCGDRPTHIARSVATMLTAHIRINRMAD